MTTFGVPASALGHMYQHRYALLLLLRIVRDRPAVELSIERVDDIALDEGNSPIARVQTKQHGQAASRSDLSDASGDLWRTLRPWAEGLADGTLRLPDTLLMLVSTTPARAGSAAALLRPPDGDPIDRRPNDALQLLLAAMTASTSKDNARAYAAFQALSSTQQLLLLQHVHVLDGSANVAGLEEQLGAQLRLSTEERLIPALLHRLEGWWHGRVLEHLGANDADRITGAELLRVLDDLRPQFHEHNLPIDQALAAIAVPEPGPDSRLFVAQLRLIGSTTEAVRRAMRDYYRAFAQRSIWTREDLLLHADELERYQERLVEEWGIAFEQMRGELGDEPTDEAKRRAGLELYAHLIVRGDIRVRRDCTERFIMRGSFHMLADDARTVPGQPRVGWHADFVERLLSFLGQPESAT